MRVNVIDPKKMTVSLCEMINTHGVYHLEKIPGEPDPDGLYLSPPWIDSHVHCFRAVTSFGLDPDNIGYKQGVHLVVDAGSSGSETFQAMREFIVEKSKTKVLAFLNISTVGHVTMREYYDMRCVDVDRTVRTLEENRDILLGIKVRSSGIIVEDKGTLPLQKAVEAAEKAGCPILVHMGETPPSNDDNLSLLRKGDIVTHCFHGKDTPLWHQDGTPTAALANALHRGVLMDVGHGAASFDCDVGRSAIHNGFKDFTISTDLHARSVNGPVYSLAHTMSKFLALGLSLVEVIRSVTLLPAERFGLSGWCDNPTKNATLFRIINNDTQKNLYVDSKKKVIPVSKTIIPTKVLMNGKMIELNEL